MADQAERTARLGRLRDRLWAGLQALGDVALNGAPAPRLPHNLNVTSGGVDGLTKVMGKPVAFNPGPDDASRIKAVYALRAELLPEQPYKPGPTTAKQR